jgi:hypothetical protein
MRMVGRVWQSWRGFDGNVEVVTRENLLERCRLPKSPHVLGGQRFGAAHGDSLSGMFIARETVNFG